jgi:UDP-N-acetyl-D-glucosamine dehydrogenase
MPGHPEPATRVVCIQGLGFVGAAMAVAVASARDSRGRAPLTAIRGDLPTPLRRERIHPMNAGRFPFRTGAGALIEATSAARAAGNLSATSDATAFARADVVVIDVHLDVARSGEQATIDYTPFRAALRTVASQARPGTLLIVETTVPPGTCERVVVPEVAAALRARGLAEDALLIAHSYERVMPGEDYLASITNFWRVYAGHTSAAADACEAFLSQVINVADYPLTRLASTTASETAKVLENSYRATNIAFIEEWGRFAEAVGIDLFEVLTAIRRRPTHNNIRQPGFGVGGYCLTKDPLFVGIAARELFDRGDLRFPFSEMAVQVNARMPMVSLDRVQDLLGGTLAGKRILLMGVAYRQDVADTRYSPAESFVVEGRRRGAEVLVHDPLVTDWPELGMAVAAEPPPARSLDAVVLAVPHRAYRTFDFAVWLRDGKPLVLDANAVLTPVQRRAVLEAGCALHAIGEGRRG